MSSRVGGIKAVLRVTNQLTNYQLTDRIIAGSKREVSGKHGKKREVWDDSGKREGKYNILAGSMRNL